MTKKGIGKAEREKDEYKEKTALLVGVTSHLTPTNKNYIENDFMYEL